MIKILIVDDQEVVRKGIIKMLNELNMNIGNIYEAVNGIDAIRIARENNPEIILTDIIMPDLDGMNMIEELKKSNCQSRIIIISAYNDFNYAQRAIGFKVDGYLLKPISKNELYRVLVSVMEDISNHAEEAERQSRKEKQYYFLLLYEYLIGKDVLVNSDILYLNTGIMSMKKADFLITLIYCDNMNANMIEHEQGKIDQKLSSYNFTFISFGNGGRNIIYIVNTEDTENEIVYHLISEYVKKAGHSLKCGISGTVKGYDNLPELYRQAEAAIKISVFKDYPVYIYTDLKWFSKALVTEDDYKRMLDLVVSGNQEEYFRAIDLVFIKLSKEKLSIEDSRYIIYDIMNCFLIQLKEIYPWYNHKDLGELLQKSNSILGMKAVVRGLFENLFLSLKELKQTEQVNNTVQFIMSYIQKNYNKDITLSQISNELNMNYYYISSLFAKKAGMPFSEYIMKVRLEKARELLIYDNNKVYEVAVKVGFNDPKYFYRAFKKYFGVTPTEIR